MSIGASLLRFDKERKYLVADFETTGLNLGHSKPFQISYALFTMDKVLETHNFFIQWDDLRMSKGAAEVTRFNFEDYQRRAIDGKAVLESFDSYLYDPSISLVGQNWLGYDCMIHALWRRALGGKEDFSYLARAFDTVALGKAFKKGMKPDTSDLLAWQYRMLGYREKGLKVNLAQLGRDLEIKFDDSKLHDAQEDILLTIAVFRQLLWKIEI